MCSGGGDNASSEYVCFTAGLVRQNLATSAAKEDGESEFVSPSEVGIGVPDWNLEPV